MRLSKPRRPKLSPLCRATCKCVCCVGVVEHHAHKRKSTVDDRMRAEPELIVAVCADLAPLPAPFTSSDRISSSVLCLLHRLIDPSVSLHSVAKQTRFSNTVSYCGVRGGIARGHGCFSAPSSCLHVCCRVHACTNLSHERSGALGLRHV